MKSNALQTSVKLLSKKDYSSSKLRLALEKKEFSKTEIDDALAALKQKNYLNDRRYSENRAVVLLKNGYGNRYILAKLKTESLILSEDEINALRDEYQILELDVLKQTIRQRSKDNDSKSMLKVLRYLIARGFEPNLVSRELGVDDVSWD